MNKSKKKRNTFPRLFAKFLGKDSNIIYNPFLAKVRKYSSKIISKSVVKKKFVFSHVLKKNKKKNIKEIPTIFWQKCKNIFSKSVVQIFFSHVFMIKIENKL